MDFVEVDSTGGKHLYLRFKEPERILSLGYSLYGPDNIHYAMGSYNNNTESDGPRGPTPIICLPLDDWSPRPASTLKVWIHYLDEPSNRQLFEYQIPADGEMVVEPEKPLFKITTDQVLKFLKDHRIYQNKAIGRVIDALYEMDTNPKTPYQVAITLRPIFDYCRRRSGVGSLAQHDPQNASYWKAEKIVEKILSDDEEFCLANFLL